MKNQDISSVCVLGLGYIGLPTAALMASRGLRPVLRRPIPLRSSTRAPPTSTNSTHGGGREGDP